MALIHTLRPTTRVAQDMSADERLKAVTEIDVQPESCVFFLNGARAVCMCIVCTRLFVSPLQRRGGDHQFLRRYIHERARQVPGMHVIEHRRKLLARA